MTELEKIRFYDHSHFTNNYYLLQIHLEKYLAKNIFKGQLDRIVYADNDYSFRRRYELVDASKPFDSPSSLKFPFLNYWPADGNKITKRPNAKPASLSLKGRTFSTQSDELLPAIATNTVFECTAYFDRDDDARLAYELLMYEFHPTRALLSTSIIWKNEEIGIPITLNFEEPVFNPTFSNNDWLINNRIIPITFTVNVDSYIVGYPSQGDNWKPIRDDGFSALTESVKLDFSSQKNISDPSSDILILEGLFSPTPSIVINYFGVDVVLDGIVNLKWDITSPAIEAIIIKINAQPPITITTPTNIANLSITNLVNNSTYSATALIELTNGQIKLINFTITTFQEPTEAIALKPASKLVGMTW